MNHGQYHQFERNNEVSPFLKFVIWSLRRHATATGDGTGDKRWPLPPTFQPCVVWPPAWVLFSHHCSLTGSWLIPYCLQTQPPGSGFLLFPPYTCTEGALWSWWSLLKYKEQTPFPEKGSYVSKRRGLLESWRWMQGAEAWEQIWD